MQFKGAKFENKVHFLKSQVWAAGCLQVLKEVDNHTYSCLVHSTVFSLESINLFLTAHGAQLLLPCEKKKQKNKRNILMFHSLALWGCLEVP